MFPVARFANGRLVRSLRLASLVLLVNAVVLATGCSWFKKKPVEVGNGTPPEMPTATATPVPGASETPASVDKEGPRPGDTLPFPELKTIYFDTDQSTLRPDQLPILEANLAYLKAHPGDKVLITGHCDERNTAEYNLALGERRAAAVRDYYVKEGGIEGGRVAILSKGEEEPVALGHDEESWAKNRRCEFQRMM
jgi:peptidoglycan-associated lipoprotein